MKNRIVLILPFYGKLPWYFNYFLKSLDGKRFDVLFVSDLMSGIHPGNFRVLQMSLEEFQLLLNRKLGTEVELRNTYKLCDFKPMYGKIFEDFISEYTYWGFCDCDMVFGEMLNPILQEVEHGTADVVSFQKNWIAGPFTLLRNTAEVKALYQQARNLADVYNSEKCVCFDELCGQWFAALESGTMTMADCEREQDSFSAVVWRARGLVFDHENRICEDSVRVKGVTMDDNGRLWLGTCEVPMFHYINAKHQGYFHGCERSYDAIRTYHINYTGFFHSDLSWKFRWLVSLYRMLAAKRRWYAQQIRDCGILSFIAYVVRRLMGRPR